MKNNKIYMILAHLYDQVKGVIGDTGRNLSEEIDERVKNQREVIAARKGHHSLLEKINAIDRSVDGTGSEIMQISGRINKTEGAIVTINDELEVIKTTNPTVQLENGEHMLVNVEKRPNHKSVTFSLNANEVYRTNANVEHYVNQLYVRDNIHNKEIDMSFKDDNSNYDKTINLNVDGSLQATQIGDMILPLHLCMIANQNYDNVAVLPEICEIHGIINSPYIDEKQHVATAFKSGYAWSVRSNMPEMVFKFVKPVYIKNICFDFTANTQQQSVGLYELVDEKWVESTRVPATDGKIDVLKEVTSIKLTFFSMSSSPSTMIAIRNVKIKTRAYSQKSGIAKVTELIDLYDLSGYATLAPISEIPNDTICKFAISSTSDNDCFAYYPSRRILEPGIFKNTYGQTVIGDLKSEIRRNSLMDYRCVHEPPTGNEGNLSFGPVVWSEDISFRVDNGYQIDALNYLTLQIRAKDDFRDIPINASHLNKSTPLSIDGTEVDLQVKKVGSSIKIAVSSQTPLAEVRYNITSLQNVFTNGSGNAIRPRHYSTTSIHKVNTSDIRYTLTANYISTKDHYRLSGSNWFFSHCTHSKYNQTRRCSIVAIDTQQVYANPARHSLSKPSNTHDINTFSLSNTLSAVAYIGVDGDANNAFLEDSFLVAKDTVTQVSPSNEFIGCLKRGLEQKVVRLEPKQEANRLDDVEYFVSYNNYNFYTYNANNNSWVQTKNGMTLEDVIRIPSYAYEKLLTTENIYIKVKINDSKARVDGIEVEFDKDHFKMIDESSVPIYGMNPSDIKNISASFILDLINKFSTLTVLMHAESKLNCWPYLVPGIQLIEYGGISWAVADQTVAKQHISGNMLIITNVANEIRHFRLEQKFFEDSIVVVGDRLQNQIFEEAITTMQNLENQVSIAASKVGVLDQNVQLLHDALLEGTKPPQELPTYIIPAQIEVDLEPLGPGSSTEIYGIKNLRYIQFWDTQLHPIPEFIEHKTVKDLQHHFIYENGAFAANYFEMGKTYDTDNAYMLPSSLSSSTASGFNTSSYRCDVRRSDGVVPTARNSKLPAVTMSTPADGNIYWTQVEWASSRNNYVVNLPGENARWVDFDLKFNNLTYVHGLLEMDCGGTTINDAISGSSANSRYQFIWQVTTVFLDYDGSENWVEHSRRVGFGTNVNVFINREVKGIRIRLEVPYSHNRGAGSVALKYFEVWHCPVRYIHDDDATIKPVLYYNTETWKRLMSVHSDATISGTTTDIRYLFETNNKLQNDKKYWGFNGTALIERTACTYNNGMRLQQFNNLTEEQLSSLLNYDYVRPIAILGSIDGHHSPQLRSFKMNYAEKEYDTTTLVNPQEINTRYDKEAEKLIVTNATKSIKTLKAIIS